MELYDTRRTKFVSAHNSSLAALALSNNGKLLATASEKGTLVRPTNKSRHDLCSVGEVPGACWCWHQQVQIAAFQRPCTTILPFCQVRVFSTADGSKLRELRRGSDPAIIYSLAFSRGDQPAWLAATRQALMRECEGVIYVCWDVAAAKLVQSLILFEHAYINPVWPCFPCSDKGTAHVFSLAGRKQQQGGTSSEGGGSEQAGVNGAPGDSSTGGSSNPLAKLSFVSVSDECFVAAGASVLPILLGSVTGLAGISAGRWSPCMQDFCWLQQTLSTCLVRIVLSPGGQPHQPSAWLAPLAC